MYNPTTRLLTILELLQARQQLSGAELAARLEVDRRTIRRYITMLQDLGIPIEALSGRYGGYRLRPGYKLPPLIFNEEEAVALVLGLLAARRLGIASSAPAIEGALAKIERVMPTTVRERVANLERAVALDLAPAVRDASGPLVASFGAAAQQGQPVTLRYRTREQSETERRFDPYGVVYYAGLWYTVGYCHLRDDLRTFRLDRIVSVEPLPEASGFARPPDFDSVEYVRRLLATTPRTWTVAVTLFTSVEGARAHLPQSVAAIEVVADGVLVRCTTDSLDWFASILAGLQCDFVIHEPVELFDALRRRAARLLAYADRADSGPTSAIT